MNAFLADCRHAMRLYSRTPGAVSFAILVLAIGVAFVGAFLSLYVDLVLRPYPGFEQSSRLVTLSQNTGDAFLPVPFGLVDRISSESSSAEAAAMWSAANTFVDSDTEATVTAMVSREFFSGLRPRLWLGRGFEAGDHEPDAEPVVILSYRAWQQRFEGDRSVLGTLLEISRDPDATYSPPPNSGFPPPQVEPEQESAQFRVIGVLDSSLQGLPSGGGGSFDPLIWVPLEPTWPIFRGVPESLPGMFTGAAYVRRAPGVSIAALVNELRGRFGGPDASWNSLPGTRLDAIDGLVGNISQQRETKRQLELFLFGSVLLAVVAAANVSLFLLARAPGRRRELGVRMAVGAPMRRLARQLATEASLLVAVAAALGLLASLWLSLSIRSLSLLRDAGWRDVTLLDWRVLCLTGGFLLILAILVSLAPIVGLKRLGIAESSRQVAARASWAQRIAGTIQIALAGVFVGAAVAFGWYVGSLMFGDPGFETEDRYAISFNRFMSVTPAPENPSPELLEQRAIVEGSRRREIIEAIPGVTAAAFGEPVPGYQRFGELAAEVADPNDASRQLEFYSGSTSRAFVDILGLDLLYGRVPDNYESGVVVVNQSAAQLLYGRDDVVGERAPGNPRWSFEGAEIVGVLRDLPFLHPLAAVKPRIFGTSTPGTAVVESELTAAGLRQAFDGLIADGVIDAQIGDIEPLPALRSNLTAPDRIRGSLTVATAALVVLLAAFGFYGMQRYLVSAGQREYAIRASLGAGPTALGRLVFFRGLILGFPGLVIGGLLAFIAVSWLRDDFVSRDISAGLVTIWVIVALILLLLAASVGPARQARKTQPAPLLRED